LLNRAIAGQYPPGSVFKPIVALAALAEERIAADTVFLCEGVERLGDHDFICMRRAVHGHISVADALMVSCNIFFYHAGRALGSRLIYIWAERLGLGHRTGIDLAGEAPGHLPREAFSGRGWALGNTYHLSIGQGPIAVTPLQIAVATAAIANGGKVVRPHLIYDPAQPEYDEPRAILKISPAALAAVRQGMWQVVQENRGTGKEARLAGLAIAGKTGSAEWRKGQPTHAWFACYAPADNPQVVCVILVPEGNFGGHTCAPIARRILALYFNLPEEEGLPEEEALG
ncbi:MAG: penicillin-binding transpeptidase domain-containing protein, partial [Planctomycetota bacterium]|nr:penicillin-binding transpeptidase domain-containing protein [Planctomycetota bacterium]